MHPHSQQEFALARKESKIAKGHQGFAMDCNANITLEEDLRRRDLSINAIAVDAKGRVHDPYGGLADLQNRYLRHVSDAFVEDPLRLFRVARFYARFAHLGFRIHPQTLQLMRQLASGEELRHLSAERVWQETQLALLSHSPQLFLRCLHQVNALKDWFPELQCLFGVPQTARWHPEVDTGVHTLMVIEQANKLSRFSQQPLAVMWSALCHDLGKGVTPAHILPSHHGHEQRGIPLTQQLNKRLKVPKVIAETALLATCWHSHLHRYRELKPSTYVKVLQQTDAWRRPQRFVDLLLVSEADARGRLGYTYQPYLNRPLWLKLQQATLGIKPNGRDLQPSKVVLDIYQQRLQAIKRVLASE